MVADPAWIASLNEAVTMVVSATPTEPLAGNRELTTGPDESTNTTSTQ